MKKETIVLLPGYDGNGVGTFTQLNQLLTERHNCLVINYPYNRQTDKAYTLKELLTFTRRIISERNLTHFHLVGFSMGGFVASAYAVKFPNQVKSLTLVSSAVSPQLSAMLRIVVNTAYYVFKIPLLARVFTFIYCSPLLAGLVKFSPLPLPRDQFPSREGYPVFGTLANVLHTTINSGISFRIREVEIPKQAILFEDDPSFPANLYSHVLSNVGFKVITYNHGGHASSNEYWQLVAKSILP